MTTQPKQETWGFWLDIIGVLCSAVYFGMSLLAAYIPEDGSTALYWSVVFVNRVACPSVIILVLIPIVLAITRIRSKPIIEFVAVTGLFLCLGSIFFLIRDYQHMDSAEINERVYYLGVIRHIRPEQTYMVCQCEQDGRCHCDSFYSTKLSSSQPARFIANAAKNELKVQVGDQVLYNVLAKCYYADLHPPCSDKSDP
jgi:hypothetical protein